CDRRFFLHYSVDPLYLHSFPTRRSSDLATSRCSLSSTASSNTTDSARAPRPGPASSRARPPPDTHPVNFVDEARMRIVAGDGGEDRKSTRLNSSHVATSYAAFCLTKKKT